MIFVIIRFFTANRDKSVANGDKSVKDYTDEILTVNWQLRLRKFYRQPWAFDWPNVSKFPIFKMLFYCTIDRPRDTPLSPSLDLSVSCRYRNLKIILTSVRQTILFSGLCQSLLVILWNANICINENLHTMVQFKVKFVIQVCWNYF